LREEIFGEIPTLNILVKFCCELLLQLLSLQRFYQNLDIKNMLNLKIAPYFKPGNVEIIENKLTDLSYRLAAESHAVLPFVLVREL
jgi:hypothetical protein